MLISSNNVVQLLALVSVVAGDILAIKDNVEVAKALRV